eukprot:7728735-Pyramimonas_sp.AAC.1
MGCAERLCWGVVLVSNAGGLCWSLCPGVLLGVVLEVVLGDYAVVGCVLEGYAGVCAHGGCNMGVC